MKITASKKSFRLILVLSLAGISIVSLFFLLRKAFLLPNSIGWEGVKVVGTTESFCESLGCIHSQDGLTYSIPTLRILGLSKNALSPDKIEISAEIWNANNNEIKDVMIELDKSLVRNFEDLAEDRLPRNFSIEILLGKLVFPKLTIDKEMNLSVYRYEVSEIVFKDLQEQYLGKDRNLLKLKEEILASLQQKEVYDDGIQSDQVSVISNLFLYWSTITESRLNYSKDWVGDNRVNESSCVNVNTPSLYYKTINIWDMGGIAEQKSAEELVYNCAVLKKYFPEENCTNPYPELKEEIGEILSTLDIPSEEEQQTPIAKDSIVGNSEYVLQVRNDPKHWADLNLMRIFGSHIARYIEILVEYMYYSDITCEDEVGAEICRDIYPLYRYLNARRGLGFCARRTFLPIFSIVSGDENIKNDLDYVLENYPFEKECTVKGGAEGFCAIDLKERVACMEFLSESLEYHDDNVEIEETLKQLTTETLDLYLEENSGKVGVWGRDEINIVSGDSIEEDLYPVKYYDYQSNYVIYNILDKYFSE